MHTREPPDTTRTDTFSPVSRGTPRILVIRGNRKVSLIRYFVERVVNSPVLSRDVFAEVGSFTIVALS